MSGFSKDDLRDRLRQCAELAGSGDALSQKTAIPRRTLETYLTGESEPKASRLVAIAAAAGVSVDWLATGRGERGLGAVPALDAEFNARIVESVVTVYKECGAAISPRDLGRVVAEIHNEIALAGLQSFEEKTGALSLASGQLRRRLLGAGTVETKRLA